MNMTDTKEDHMSSTARLLSAVGGFVLLGIYSWVMTAGDGRPASWAWIMLLAAVALLLTSARSYAAVRAADRHDD
jgi:Na+/melibiose symporter-like transporter